MKTAQGFTRNSATPVAGAYDQGSPRSKAPTAKMVAYAQSLARCKKLTLPEGYEQDFDACRWFLDTHAR